MARLQSDGCECGGREVEIFDFFGDVVKEWPPIGSYFGLKK